MYNYDIKWKIESRNFLQHLVREMFEKLALLFGTLTRQVEILTRHLARWHANKKQWHAE